MLKNKYSIGTGARKGFIEKPVQDRRGPATVMGSKAKEMPLRRNCLGKVWRRNDPEPGELPV